MLCKLCSSETQPFYHSKRNNYVQCEHCSTVQMHPDTFPSPDDERTRYEEHNNDVNDPRYQEFVKPITSEILMNFSKNQHGLDFGCGTGPVITTVLRKHGFQINTYDPFFDNNKAALNKTYDYIVCCEVIEHFHHPMKEFELLKSLLKPKGKLYCMTDLYHTSINFDKWYYKNDDTHVIFYHKNGLNFIQQKIGFSKLHIDNRLIIFDD